MTVPFGYFAVAAIEFLAGVWICKRGVFAQGLHDTGTFVALALVGVGFVLMAPATFLAASTL